MIVSFGPGLDPESASRENEPYREQARHGTVVSVCVLHV